VSLLRLTRLSAAPPPARDLLRVEEDGSMTGWRSQGDVVGAFAGPAPDLGRLRSLVTAAVGVPPPAHEGAYPHDGTVETLQAGEAEFEVDAHARPDGPWGELLSAARELLDDTLPTMPAGAVALVVAAGAPRLEHRGERPITLELGSGWAEVTRWRDDAPVGDAETRDLGLGRVEAGPGWSAEVTLRAPDGEAGDLLTASAWFVADDGGVHVPVVVTGRATAS
jgi:hypothetical protein